MERQMKQTESQKQNQRCDNTQLSANEGTGSERHKAVTWDSFLENTTLHGIKYVIQKESTKVKRFVHPPSFGKHFAPKLNLIECALLSF